jgi:hypothetical protein
MLECSFILILTSYNLIILGVEGYYLHLTTLNDTHAHTHTHIHSEELLWMREQPIAETST